MNDTMTKSSSELIVSEMAENLIGSEIIRLGGEIRERIRQGEKIYNFTIGDFDPNWFPIPTKLKEYIIEAYEIGQTNYPASNGIPELREAVHHFLLNRLGLDYSENQILVSGGARPLIYATYRTLIDAGDKVIFPVPSWNNNHYCHLTGAEPIAIEVKPEENFLPRAEDIKPHISEAKLLALCSPLNPTGTAFSEDQLRAICELVLEENQRRSEDEKPLYLLYDQIYWLLTYGQTEHLDPVSLYPELKEYTIYMDGLTKAFSATGLRVGWAFGPQKIMDKMKSILGHVGAWSPRAEQWASAKFLNNTEAVDDYLDHHKKELELRLEGFYKGFTALAADGFKVQAIPPQAAIYLTVQFDLLGKTTPSGTTLNTTEDITGYLLSEAQLAIVPFYAFGASRTSTWFRLSVGTSNPNEIPEVFDRLRKVLGDLT